MTIKKAPRRVWSLDRKESCGRTCGTIGTTLPDHMNHYLSVLSPNAGKYGPEKTPYLNTFYAVKESFQ